MGVLSFPPRFSLGRAPQARELHLRPPAAAQPSGDRGTLPLPGPGAMAIQAPDQPREPEPVLAPEPDDLPPAGPPVTRDMGTVDTRVRLSTSRFRSAKGRDRVWLPRTGVPEREPKLWRRGPPAFSLQEGCSRALQTLRTQQRDTREGREPLAGQPQILLPRDGLVLGPGGWELGRFLEELDGSAIEGVDEVEDRPRARLLVTAESGPLVVNRQATITGLEFVLEPGAELRVRGRGVLVLRRCVVARRPPDGGADRRPNRDEADGTWLPARIWVEGACELRECRLQNVALAVGGVGVAELSGCAIHLLPLEEEPIRPRVVVPAAVWARGPRARVALARCDIQAPAEQGLVRASGGAGLRMVGCTLRRWGQVREEAGDTPLVVALAAGGVGAGAAARGADAARVHIRPQCECSDNTFEGGLEAVRLGRGLEAQFVRNRFLDQHRSAVVVEGEGSWLRADQNLMRGLIRPRWGAPATDSPAGAAAIILCDGGGGALTRNEVMGFAVGVQAQGVARGGAQVRATKVQGTRVHGARIGIEIGRAVGAWGPEGAQDVGHGEVWSEFDSNTTTACAVGIQVHGAHPSRLTNNHVLHGQVGIVVRAGRRVALAGNTVHGANLGLLGCTHCGHGDGVDVRGSARGVELWACHSHGWEPLQRFLKVGRGVSGVALVKQAQWAARQGSAGVAARHLWQRAEAEWLSWRTWEQGETVPLDALEYLQLLASEMGVFTPLASTQPVPEIPWACVGEPPDRLEELLAEGQRADGGDGRQGRPGRATAFGPLAQRRRLVWLDGELRAMAVPYRAAAEAFEAKAAAVRKHGGRKKARRALRAEFDLARGVLASLEDARQSLASEAWALSARLWRGTGPLPAFVQSELRRSHQLGRDAAQVYLEARAETEPAGTEAQARIRDVGLEAAALTGLRHLLDGIATVSRQDWGGDEASQRRFMLAVVEGYHCLVRAPDDCDGLAPSARSAASLRSEVVSYYGGEGTVGAGQLQPEPGPEFEEVVPGGVMYAPEPAEPVKVSQAPAVVEQSGADRRKGKGKAPAKSKRGFWGRLFGSILPGHRPTAPASSSSLSLMEDAQEMLPLPSSGSAGASSESELSDSADDAAGPAGLAGPATPECMVCYLDIDVDGVEDPDMAPADALVGCSCGTVVCAGCLATVVVEEDQRAGTGAVCPSVGCGAPVTRRDLELLGHRRSQADNDAYVARVVSKWITRQPGFVPCPDVGCPGGQLRPRAPFAGESVVVSCFACGEEQVRIEEGDDPLFVLALLRGFQASKTKNGDNRERCCPSCAQPGSKVSGCLYMTCACGIYYDWSDGEVSRKSKHNWGKTGVSAQGWRPALVDPLTRVGFYDWRIPVTFLVRTGADIRHSVVVAPEGVETGRIEPGRRLSRNQRDGLAFRAAAWEAALHAAWEKGVDADASERLSGVPLSPAMRQLVGQLVVRHQEKAAAEN